MTDMTWFGNWILANPTYAELIIVCETAVIIGATILSLNKYVSKKKEED